MEIRLAAEILITTRGAKVITPKYPYPLIEIGFDGSADIYNQAVEWLQQQSLQAARIQELALRVIGLSDRLTADEIERLIGARTVVARLHRIDNEAPVYEHQWEVGDIRFWVLISLGQIVGVRAR